MHPKRVRQAGCGPFLLPGVFYPRSRTLAIRDVSRDHVHGRSVFSRRIPQGPISGRPLNHGAMLTLGPKRDGRGRGAKSFVYRGRVVVWALNPTTGYPRAVPKPNVSSSRGLSLHHAIDRQSPGGPTRGRFAGFLNERPGPPHVLGSFRPAAGSPGDRRTFIEPAGRADRTGGRRGPGGGRCGRRKRRPFDAAPGWVHPPWVGKPELV